MAGQLSDALSDSLSSLTAAQGEARELRAGLVAVKRQNIGWQRHCRELALRLSQTQAQLAQVDFLSSFGQSAGTPRACNQNT